MKPLPWTPGTAHQATSDEVVVMASRLELRRLRDVPAFLRAALRLRRRFTTTPGGMGLSLYAQPASKRFYTLSAWTDEAAMAGFTRDPAHVEVMTRFRPRMAGSRFTTWTPAAGTVPTWPDALAQLAAADERAVASRAQG